MEKEVLRLFFAEDAFETLTHLVVEMVELLRMVTKVELTAEVLRMVVEVAQAQVLGLEREQVRE